MLETLKSIESDVSTSSSPQSAPSSFTKQVGLVVQQNSRRPMPAKSALGKVVDPSGAQFNSTRCVKLLEFPVIPTGTPAPRTSALRSRLTWILTVAEFRGPIAGRDQTTDRLLRGS